MRVGGKLRIQNLADILIEELRVLRDFIVDNKALSDDPTSHSPRRARSQSNYRRFKGFPGRLRSWIIERFHKEQLERCLRECLWTIYILFSKSYRSVKHGACSYESGENLAILNSGGWWESGGYEGLRYWGMKLGRREREEHAEH